MANINLTPRLSTIANLIMPGAKVADIGTDHALLPIALVQQGRAASVVASDIKEGPLMHAEQNVAAYECSTQITLRLCQGLSAITPEDCDTICIAGMGGETIADILLDAPWTAKGDHMLLLQPMTMAAALRQFLFLYGYRIEKECVCQEEHRWYIVLQVRGGGECKRLPLEACFSSDALLHAPNAVKYLTWVLSRETRALEGMQRGNTVSPTLLRRQANIVTALHRELEKLR